MLRVQFDHQIFRLQETGGISRYFVELAKAFYEHPELGIEPVFNFKYTCNRHLCEAFPNLGFRLIENQTAKFILKILAFFPNFLASSIDCVHYTYYMPFWLQRKLSVPTVSTLHDMIPELLGSKPGLRNPHLFKIKYLKKSSAVISVSESTVSDFRNLVNGPRKDIHVIPHGTGLKSKIALGSPAIRENFLYVGKRAGYKDGMISVKALKYLQNPNIKLVFVGGGDFSVAEKELLRDLGLVSQVSSLTPTDATLVELYSTSKALISTSQFEGFGLPALEASLFKCPLILTSIPPYKEILGSSAFYFDVGAEDQLAKQMLHVLENPKEVEKFAETSYRVAKSFTWETCANLTSKVYKELVKAN